MKLFLLLFCVVPLISSGQWRERETKCIAKYLIGLELIDETFEKNDPECYVCDPQSSIYVKDKLLGVVQKSVDKTEFMRKDVVCIKENLKKLDVGIFYLIFYVYGSTEGIDNHTKQEKKMQMEKSVTLAIAKSFQLCKTMRKFRKSFDDDIRTNEIDPKDDFCIRKHIDDYGLIDVANVSIALNPKGIDTSNFLCEIILATALRNVEEKLVRSLHFYSIGDEDLYFGIDEKSFQCIRRVVPYNVINRMFQLDYIKEMNLTETQNNEMRENYIKRMTKLADESLKCFLEVEPLTFLK